MGIHELLPALDRFGFYCFQCILTFLWQSSFILLPAVVALRLLRNRSPMLRNIIALTGFVSIPAILGYSWFFSFPPVPSRPIPVMPEYSVASRFSSPIRENFTELDRGGENDPGLAGGFTGLLPGRKDGYDSPDDAHGPVPPITRDSRFFPWAFALIVYVVLQTTLFLRFIFDWGCIRWWIGLATPVEDIAVCRVFWRAAYELELRTGKFDIAESDSMTVPVTVGAFRPRIIFPRGFPGRCSREDFRAVVCHELAHVSRQDPLIFTCISLMRTFLFFHPLIHVMAGQYSLIAEQACDDAAVEASGLSSFSYARSLARMAEQLAVFTTRPAAALGLFREKSFLFHRLESILSDSPHSNPRLHPLLSSIIAACLALFLAAAVALPLVARDPGSVKTEVLPEGCSATSASRLSTDTAYAVPLRNIRIDGALDDWPEDMIRYPIRDHRSVYGLTDLDDSDLDASPDCSPSMMAGYDSEQNLLYIAVTVIDDRVVTVRNPEWARPDLTDACEIYVDGSHRERNVTDQQSHNWEVMALKYVLCPDSRPYDRSAWLREPPYTPAIIRGNFDASGSDAVCRRRGRSTVYEWAVRVYERYPEQPGRLVPGRVIGFDVAIADKDSVGDNPAWITWGTCKKYKAYDTTSLGDLVLVERYSDLGVVSGEIRRGDEAYAGRTLELFRGIERVGEYRTDYRGAFRLVLPPGTYSVKTGNPEASDRLFLDTFTVTPGCIVYPRFCVAMNGFTRLRSEAAEFMRTLRTGKN